MPPAAHFSFEFSLGRRRLRPEGSGRPLARAMATPLVASAGYAGAAYFYNLGRYKFDAEQCRGIRAFSTRRIPQPKGSEFVFVGKVARSVGAYRDTQQGQSGHFFGGCPKQDTPFWPGRTLPWKLAVACFQRTRMFSLKGRSNPPPLIWGPPETHIHFLDVCFDARKQGTLQAMVPPSFF